MRPSTVPLALLCALCVSVTEPAAAAGIQASRSVIVLPARLHGPRSESVVLRTGGAVIERVTPPAPISSSRSARTPRGRSGCMPGAEC
jgi:hypothetical protein